MQKLPIQIKGISNEENLLRNTKEYISYEERQLFITLAQLAGNKAKHQKYSRKLEVPSNFLDPSTD